jgi:anti-sigma regulatory factor (Ser/Thr protein kinase)
MRVVKTWDVADPSGIGHVRREITRILGAAATPGRTIGGVVDSLGRELGGMAELRNRVALSCSELVTNALRHGRLPIGVRLLTDDVAWMLDVTDAATDRLPEPYPERALGQGGYGLLLVARVASQLGWYVAEDGKHVWARIELAPDSDLVDELAE